MNLNDVQTLAIGLMIDHGLREPTNHWKLEFSSAVLEAGYCKYNGKTIGLSKPLMELYEYDEVRDTILHEIAHALTDPLVQAHGEEWRKVALSIGCSGKVKVDKDMPRPKGNWVGECPACGKISYMYRAPRKVRLCKDCSGPYSKWVIDWTYKGRRVKMCDSYEIEFAEIRMHPYYRFAATVFND